jgi:histidine triad (HIT) family protein
MDNNCIFCKIVNGDLAAYKIYEDDKVLAFLDVKPVNPGHTLVVPKNHYHNLENMPEEILIAIIKTVKKVGNSIKDNLAPGYNVNLNNDPVAGQEIPHTHFHVIPRNPEDHLRLWPYREYKDGEPEKIVQMIRIN